MLPTQTDQNLQRDHEAAFRQCQWKELLQAQRARIAFRDAECDFSTADSQGGSIHPMLVSGCLQGLTEALAEQLGSYLECEEGDMSCPEPAE
jgi:uncharacterized protein YecT (DUF1311 family)